MEKIRKGIIAVAGLTSRFLPASKGCPKGLLPVLEKPAIQLIVEELLGAGINEICIVHTHGDPRIKRYFTPDSELQKSLEKAGKLTLLKSLVDIQKQTKFRFIPQPRRLPYGNGTPVLAANNFIKDDPFVYIFGDDLAIENKPGQLLLQLIKVFEKYQPAAVIAVQKVPPEEISRYASMKYVKDNKYPHRVVEVLEKLPADQAPSLYGQDGRFIYSPKVIKVLENLAPSKKSGKIAELWLADANNYLAKNDVVIAEPIKNALWMTTGDPLRWLKTNILMGLKDKKIGPDLKKFLKDQLRD
jgi:UTP--glucose-1-phosphate uridylyltransferase